MEMVKKHAVTPSAPPTGTPPLYPELPAGPAVADVSLHYGNNPLDHYFRLQEISQLRKQLEDKRNKRSQLYKKYWRGINAVDAVDTALSQCGDGHWGVGLLSTVIAAPVVLGLKIAALGCGLLGVTGKFIGRRLSVKAKNMTRSEFWQRANWTISQTMSQLHSQMARFQMRNSIRSLRRPTNMPRWRQRFGQGQKRRMPQSLSTRRRKTPLFKEVESRPGQVSWRSWSGHELQSILDAVVWLCMPWVCQRGRDTDSKCHRWPTPVEPLRGAVGTPGVFGRAGGPQVGFWRTPYIKQIRLHVHKFLAIVCSLDKKKSWSWCSLLYDSNPEIGLRRIFFEGIRPSLRRKNGYFDWLHTICFVTPSGIQTWNAPLGEYTDPTSRYPTFRCPYHVEVVWMLSTRSSYSRASSLHGTKDCLVESYAFLKSSTLL